MSACISLLGWPEHRTTDRGPYTAEMYFFTFLEARSLGSHAGWADHVCPTLASSGPDRVLGDSGKEADQYGCRCQRAARLPWPAARPTAVREVRAIHAVPAAASAGPASCRGLSGLPGLLESVVMASSMECRPKAIIRWFNGVCRVVTRAVEGPGVPVSSLTRML